MLGLEPAEEPVADLRLLFFLGGSPGYACDAVALGGADLGEVVQLFLEELVLPLEGLVHAPQHVDGILLVLQGAGL